MTHHILKTDEIPFNMTASGVKDYEIRYNDRNYQVGDILELRETTYTGDEMKNGYKLCYTGAVLYRRVNSILSGYGLADNWVILNVTSDLGE